MDDPLEIELKLEYEPADRERLLASELLGAAVPENRRLTATYFDTPDFRLDKAGYALRIRREGENRTQTVKASASRSAGLFVRGEWEMPVHGDGPVLDDRAGPLCQMIDAATLERIAPVFFTDVDRRSGLIPQPEAGLIEFAVDAGEVRSGSRTLPLNEIELELKQGRPGELFGLARALDRLVPLRLGVQTKSERGYALAGEKAFTAVKAEPIRLDPAISTADAFQTIANSCLRQYRLNEALLLRAGTAEPLHQARVALRRLRSALSLFRPLFESDERATQLIDELRWLAGELGAIRDIDVLLPTLEASERPALAALRELRFDHLRGLLDEDRARLLPLGIAEWLATGAWRAEPADVTIRDRDIVLFAGERLDRLRKRIKREGKDLAALADDARHEVRKEAKRLRYAAEFFVSLYPGRKARRRLSRFLDRLEALQDKLGSLNDIAAAPALIEQLGLDITLPTSGKKEHKRLLEDAEDCFDALIDSKRFWRA